MGNRQSYLSEEEIQNYLVKIRRIKSKRNYSVLDYKISPSVQPLKNYIIFIFRVDISSLTRIVFPKIYPSTKFIHPFDNIRAEFIQKVLVNFEVSSFLQFLHTFFSIKNNITKSFKDNLDSTICRYIFYLTCKSSSSNRNEELGINATPAL